MTRKEKSLWDKLNQLDRIDRAWKLWTFKSLSQTQTDFSKQEIYHWLAKGNQAELLENMFRNKFTSWLPLKVDLTLLDVTKVSQDEWLKMITVIDDYLQWKYWTTNKWIPLHVYFEPELIQFYYTLCEKFIFDVQTLKEKQDFCVNYFKKVFLLAWWTQECIVNFERFWLTKEQIFDLIRDDVHQLINFYVDSLYQETQDQNRVVDLDSLKEYLSKILWSRVDWRLNFGKDIQNKVSFETVLSILNELDTPKTKDILHQIRNIALKAEDYHTYTYLDRVMTFWKQLNYNRSWSSVSLWTKNGQSVYAIHGYLWDKKLLFFDKDHYKIIESDVLPFASRPWNLYQILWNVFPENMGIQKHNLSAILKQEQKNEKIRKEFEKKLCIPVSSLHWNNCGFTSMYKWRRIEYGFREWFDFIEAKKKWEKISLSFNELWATTDGDTEIWKLAQEQVNQVKVVLDEYVDQMNFFYEKIKSVWDKIHDISGVWAFLKQDIFANYCLEWQAKHWKYIYIVFDKNKDFFEIKDYKDVMLVDDTKSANSNLDIIIPG